MDVERSGGKISAAIGRLQLAAEAAKESHFQIMLSEGMGKIVLVREIVSEVKKWGIVRKCTETVLEI